jgi:hypothetical protein
MDALKRLRSTCRRTDRGGFGAAIHCEQSRFPEATLRGRTLYYASAAVSASSGAPPDVKTIPAGSPVGELRRRVLCRRNTSWWTRTTSNVT